jgi:hypothetical protein
LLAFLYLLIHSSPPAICFLGSAEYTKVSTRLCNPTAILSWPW